MKKNILRIATLCLTAACCTGAMAQTALNSAYFSENSVLRHQLNPAFTPNRGYIAVLPGLAGTNIATHSNIGIDQILYPLPNGKLTTFMNSSVDKSFLNDLSDNNQICANINLEILNIGFMGFGGFNTVSLGMRTTSSLNLPKGLFEFMKLGQTGTSTTYKFNDLGMEANAYVELALGHQHKVNDNWSVGGKLKFLLGVSHADMSVDEMTMTMSDEQWRINANGEVNLAIKGLTIPTYAEAGKSKEGRPDYNNSLAFDEMDVKNPGLSGFGLAVDLGATYKAEFLEGLELSAAILDLGFINYSNNIYGSMNNTQPWTFDGFSICSNEDAPGHESHQSLSDQAEDLGNQLADYLNFKRGDNSSKKQSLAATLNIGAAYALPMYDKLRFGFLSSTRFNGPYTWSEGRISANITPVKGLDLGVNYAISTWGSSFGWLLNYTATGFSLYLGMDHTLGEVTKQFVPMSGNANFSFGIAFPFSAKKS